MRRYPPRENIPYKYSILPRAEMTNGYPSFCQSMPPPVTHGDSYSRHMAEIEFWVKTHRPPCTYGMPVPPQVQNNTNSQRPQNNTNSTIVEEKKPTGDSEIKRPVDPPDISPMKNTRKRLLTLLGNEPDLSTSRQFFPASQDSPQLSVHKTNGTFVQNTPSAKAKPAKPSNSKNNGDVSSESTKKSRARPTSTPIPNRTRNVGAGKKAKSVANKTTPKRTRAAKMQQNNIAETTDNIIDLVQESLPETSAGPSNAVNTLLRDASQDAVDDSDTSVLTAPYIRSTRNSTSKSKCQTLTRQRASQAKNKLFPTRPAAKCNEDTEADPVESQDTSASSAANHTSGVLNTTDSSMGILPDMSKESSRGTNNGSRVSSVKNVRMLHFTGAPKASTSLKRRSEPVVTRLSAKKARSLLSNSCQMNMSSATNEAQLLCGAGNLSAPCVSKLADSNRSRASILLASDEGSTRRKRFFL